MHQVLPTHQPLLPELSLPLIANHKDTMQLVERSASLGSPVCLPFLLFEMLSLSHAFGHCQN